MEAGRRGSAAAPAQPTLVSVMVRPRWILALFLALALAVVFALLGQWQLGQAVRNAVVNQLDTETVVPIGQVTQPGAPVSEQAGGRMLSVQGSYVPADYLVLPGRLNEGQTGFWLVGHLKAEGDLAVALGWSADRSAVEAARDALSAQPAAPVSLTGRYLPPDDPETAGHAAPGEPSAMSVAELVNMWSEYSGPAYGGYLVASSAPAGLTAIDSPPPVPEETLNWLNLFYAIEWAVFAGFALYFWYRLVRDAWHREIELAEAEAEAEEDVQGSRRASE